MPKTRVAFVCAACGQRSAQWAGRCGACAAWGTLEEAVTSPGGTRTRLAAVGPVALDDGEEGEARVSTGSGGFDRVLGGGLVPGSVVLLAGEPGIGKSTLLLQLIGLLTASGRSCLLASGEESRRQVGDRARRLGIDGGAVSYVPGRDLEAVLDAVRGAAPFLLAVDSIQTLRDAGAGTMPGGVSQVRGCADALVGLAKETGTVVLLTGHVTKDGDLAGPRALEHAVDVVLGFDGDPRSGLRVLGAGKNRFGAEGETAWFEMGARGLTELDPTRLLVTGERVPGAAVALPQAGRRALAVEVQALVGSADGPGRRQATGLDLRRFQLVAAVLDRAAGLGLGRGELFGATAGGVRMDDPAADLAVAAALASAASGVSPPEGAAFVGEVALTGLVRPAPAMAQRVQAARAAGCRVVYAPAGSWPGQAEGVKFVPVRHVRDALPWALSPATTRPDALPA
ncbi:MAG: ATPase domain-containing protein [Planctomycetaceae bacterium]